MTATAIYKHDYENLIRIERVRYGKWGQWYMKPVYSDACLVCSKTKETHDLPIRIDRF